jgi:CubicO group peptidase (beta-lactamase class C family)
LTYACEAASVWAMSASDAGGGYVADGFGAVARAFRKNFEQGDVGAAFCAWLDGEVVVDLWGGLADRDQGRAWEEDTMGVFFSVTKGLVYTCLLMLSDRGRLDYDERVVTYWPEFGTHGKEDITVRQLLNHRSGLSAIDEPLGLYDFEDPARVARALEKQAPMWPPGSRQGYGAVSMGPYAAELFRRVAGESVGTFFSREIARPLGIDVYIGLPGELNAKVATVYKVFLSDKIFRVLPIVATGRGVEGRIYRAFMDKTSATRRAFQNPEELGRTGVPNFNVPRVRRMELPWAGGIGTARGVARMYAALACGGSLDGVTLCRPESLTPLFKRQSWSESDAVLHKPIGFSQGFVKEEPHLFSPNSEAFGHPGAGGAVGFADPTRRLSFSYVANRMDYHLRSPRCLRLCHALYESLS